MGKKTWGNQEKTISGEFDVFIYQEPLENLGFSWEFDGFNQQIMGKETFDGQTCDFNE
jgi:hypothetical protein